MEENNQQENPRSLTEDTAEDMPYTYGRENFNTYEQETESGGEQHTEIEKPKQVASEPYGADSPYQAQSGSYNYGQTGVNQNSAPYQQNPNGAYGQGNGYQYGPLYQQNPNGPYQHLYQNGNYQQNVNGAYGQYQKADQAPGIGFGIASMILGILSLLLFCTCINIPIAIAGIVIGIIHLCRKADAKWLGITGIVTSVISILAFIITVIMLWTPLMDYYRYSSYLDFPGYDYDYDYEFNMPFSNDSGYHYHSDDF